MDPNDDENLRLSDSHKDLVSRKCAESIFAGMDLRLVCDTCIKHGRQDTCRHVIDPAKAVRDLLPRWRTEAPPPPRKVCIAGNIGAGKTTLAQSLADHLGYVLCEEPSGENEYLEDFYRDKAAHAFGCQVAFLAARFSQNLRVMSGLGYGPRKGVVQDRGPYEDVIFARMLHESGDIDDRDYRTYTDLFETLVSNLGSNIPNAVLFLDVDVDELVRRVATRGRDCEKSGGVTRDYLAQLSRQYEVFVKDMSEHTTVFRIKWDEFKDTSDLWHAVLRQYDGKPGVTTLGL